MKNHIAILLLFIISFVGPASFGQTSYCDTSTISVADKILIEQFWIGFKNAVNAEDKLKLETFINFPFNCDYCIPGSGKEPNDDFFTVTKKLYNENQYKIFFDPKLKQTINKYSNLVDILSFTYDDTGKKCSLNFGYVSVEPSKDWEGQQRFFSLDKIHGKFLITSAWTVP